MTNRLKNLDQLAALAKAKGTKYRVAVVNPNDSSTLEALRRAEADGFVEPIMVNNESHPQEAAEAAVELVQQHKADVLMKGLVHSDIMLRAILRHQGGLLPKGNVLTHIACANVPDYNKLLLYTDAAVIPFPTFEQRVQQVGYIVRLCHALGKEEPRVALIHCVEEVNERHFPYTVGYRQIVDMAREGHFGRCIIDGPLDLKTSCSPESMRVKGIDSPIAGEADALVFPDIESGNVFHKSITLFGHATLACILQGAQVPVVLPSRADNADTKYYSLALSSLLSTYSE